MGNTIVYRRLLACIGLVTFAAAVHAGPASSPASNGRTEVPDRGAQAKAEQTVRNVFRAEYANRSASARQDLARRLLDQGTKTTGDPAVRYVSLREAKDLAAGAGDASTALAAIDALAAAYVIDAPDFKASAIASASQQVTTPEGNAALAQLGLDALDEAIHADNLQAANRLGAALEPIAARSKQLPLVTTVAARNREVAELRRDADAVRAAQETLKTKPGDADANLIVARHLAFLKGEWATALPMLAKSSDASLKVLAERELAKPADAVAEAQLADGWWDVAQKQPETQKARVHQHAIAWYTRAWPQLTPEQHSKCASGHLPADVLAQLNAPTGSTPVAPIGSPGAVARPGANVPPPPSGKATLVRAFPAQADVITSVQITPDLHRILAAAKPAGDAISPVLWDADTGAAVAMWHGPTGVLLPDGKRAAVQYERKWHVVDTVTGKDLSVIANLDAWGALLSEDGSRLLLYKTGKDGFIAMCDLNNGAEPKRFDGSTIPVALLAIARDGRSFISVPMWTDFQMRNYSSDTGRELWRVEVPGGCDRVSYSRDGTRIVRVAHASADLSIHDARTGEMLALCRGNKRCVQAALASSNRFVVTATDDPDSGLRLFDLASASADPKKPCKPLDWPSIEPAGPATALALSTDDRRVLVANKDKVVRLIDVQTGRVLAKLEGISGETLCLGFSADGRFAVTGGDDKIVRLWRLPDPPRASK